MRKVILLLVLSYMPNVFADNASLLSRIISPVQIHKWFIEQNFIDKEELRDLVDKEIKINLCVDEYIKRQSKSYSKIVQNNLYDLINNFDRITSKIYGKQIPKDNIPYNEKIEALAKLQCDAYYTMNILK